jgi:intracellular septation protein
VNKSFVKFVTDFGPLAIFIYIYYSSGKDIKVALVPFIIATVVALILVWLLEKRVPMVPLLGGVLVTFFGGLTIYFDNPIFIYIKPTIINILFGIGLLVGKFFTDEPLLKKMLGNSLSLTDEGWKVLNLRWVYFFFGLALLNEIIWRTQSEEFWVNFKVWGILPITIIFTAFQLSVITKFKSNE